MTGTDRTTDSEPRAGTPVPDGGERMEGAGLFGGLSALGLVAVVLGAIPFLFLTGLVQTRWEPLQRLDDDVAQGLNDALATAEAQVRTLEVVTEVGGGAPASWFLGIAVVWLLVRRQRRVAAYLAVTGLGLAVLVPVTKLLIGRERPEVLVPVATLPTNASFPSGHAMTALVIWGAIALVALPVVRPSRRWVVVTATVGLVAVTGFTRLALGVHFLSDVLAGWALGAAWLAVTTIAFRGWLANRHLAHVDTGLGEAPVRALHPRTIDENAVPAGWRTAGLVALLAAGIAAVLASLGLLVTGPLATTAVGEADGAAVDALLELRTDGATAVIHAVDRTGGLWGVVVAGVALAALSVAYRGSWRPAVLVVTALVGEVVLYGTVSAIVGRARPDVRDLTEGLPTDAAFPSGHVAAATVLYGCLVAIVLTYGRGWWRWLVLAAAALLVLAVMVGRVYVAAHDPTDTLGGLLLGVLWVWGLHRVLLAPGTGRTSAWRWDAPRGVPS